MKNELRIDTKIGKMINDHSDGNCGVKIDTDNEILSASFNPTIEHEYAVSYYVYYSNVYEYTYNWFSYTGGFNDMAALGWLRGDGLLLFDPAVDSKY